MTATADILTALSGAEKELDEAKTHNAGGRDHADRVRTQALGQGFLGVAQHMTQVITAFDDAQITLGNALAAVGDARSPVGEIKDGMTPDEVKTRLNTSIASIDRSAEAILATYPAFDEAENVVKSALAGGDPGPLLRFISMANEAAARGKAQAATAKTKAQAQIPQASSLGN
ncbi:hypothetical protein Lfu02_00640 [Longispora fulva]|uniref:Uncharacterized protein n=1 Tax=Longispora fulva TaxID=619741 RepID=A0A8J7KFE0_9ACTN|nr:DUF6244 family protein [Longispora fulva]MBG6136065.1 hypothetical protein [Longispora fulva]GIG55692.1 hypothetical protein Lfu02_00640 [Longispora fulva]